ncbi:type II secretion system protein [Haloplanus sp. C73]|uniref:type II secretion system protein n=1 Tax=Haloplanus sp. C73 TaxID=3421641 RepID=UPI003EC11E8A
MTGLSMSDVASWWPWQPEPAPELDRALAYLDAGVDAETLERAARVVASAVLALGVVVATVLTVVSTSRIGIGVGAGIGAVGLAIPVVARHGPPFLATMARTRALGSAASLVGRAALRLRIDPTVERAAAFAAETGTGALARSLTIHVKRAAGTPRSGFERFAQEWSVEFPALERSVARLNAAASASPAERDRQLDRAVEASLDGVRDELASFTSEIRGAVTGLYAFGVLLPLALVGVLPAARATGVRLSLPLLAVLYDGVLPVGVLVAGAWLLARRPVAFPPPHVARTHPDVPSSRWKSVASGAVAAVGSAVVAARVVAPWAAPIAAVGLGCGVALVVDARAAKRVSERVEAVEAELHDACYLVGRRVAAGDAVETAIADAAERVPGATGSLLDDVARRQRRLGIPVSEACSDAVGAVPSRRLREVASLFDLAAVEGRPAGDALVATATHLEELERVEREARRDLSRLTDTLSNTAAIFGPVVGGTTVALSARVAQAGTATQFGAGALPTPQLGLVVGAYVLWLAGALTVLSVGLTRGLDWTLVRHRVGVALSLATLCYLAAYVGAGLFL